MLPRQAADGWGFTIYLSILRYCRQFPVVKRFILPFYLFALIRGVAAQSNPFAAANDVTWLAFGTNENNSMPLGNGDVALNVWTEPAGDIVFLIAKSDAWSENGQLLKVGRVRVRLTPNPFASGAAFRQTLKLEQGEIELRGDNSTARLWVDANHPVVHLDVQALHPLEMTARAELWRLKPYHLSQRAVQQAGFFEWGNNPNGLSFAPDTVLPADPSAVSWCHFNSTSIYPLVFEREHLGELLSKYPDPLLHRCFGALMEGPGLRSTDPLTLASAAAARTQHLDIHVLTTQCQDPEAWHTAIKSMAGSDNRLNRKAAWRRHREWWTAFWNRSWIHVRGSATAEEVSQSYAIQRFMTACAGRGAQPIKFNGSLFTVGHDLPEGGSSSAEEHDPDFRAWGASFWNQNTRLIYWPLLATGDGDLMAPWFNMYVQALPLAVDRTRAYFHHEGGAFIETIYFWGLPNVNDFGWDNPGPELESEWMRYHVQGGLEVLAQMLDFYDYTENAEFAHGSLLPMADAVITYYAQHWKTGPDGKLLLKPAQSLETYQTTAVNPTPDIAGLMDVLPRLLSLPAGTGSAAEKALWSQVLQELPPLPLGRTANGKLPPRAQGDPAGRPTILPAAAYGSGRNVENPELYTVFPYRLYGVGKPNLALARNTYAARLHPFSKCWGQDGTQSATLGLTDEAKRVVLNEFTSYGNQQFRWFWSKNSDWIPDMDNGGSGMITLQLMLLQCDGKRIQLLPAWPEDWTADFKLHAPYQTTVEGHVEHGTLTRLKVTPKARTRDVVIVRHR